MAKPDSRSNYGEQKTSDAGKEVVAISLSSYKNQYQIYDQVSVWIYRMKKSFLEVLIWSRYVMRRVLFSFSFLGGKKKNRKTVEYLRQGRM